MFIDPDSQAKSRCEDCLPSMGNWGFLAGKKGGSLLARAIEEVSGEKKEGESYGPIYDKTCLWWTI